MFFYKWRIYPAICISYSLHSSFFQNFSFYCIVFRTHNLQNLLCCLWRLFYCHSISKMLTKMRELGTGALYVPTEAYNSKIAWLDIFVNVNFWDAFLIFERKLKFLFSVFSQSQYYSIKLNLKINVFYQKSSSNLWSSLQMAPLPICNKIIFLIIFSCC